MGSEHQKQVLDQIKTQNVRTVRLCFSDILGRLKGFAVPAIRMKEALDEGMGFDGSSIEGFCRIFESDLLAMPDAATFRVLPWTTDGEKIGMMFCDIPAGPVDCAIAIDHMSLAATAEGLGTCWIGHFHQDKCGKILNVPASAKIVEMLLVGYAAAEPGAKKRKDLKEIVCWEKFS